jgi:hypothetical protein
MRPRKFDVGQRFGRWVLMERLPGKRAVLRCDCGTVRTRLVNGLGNGSSKSCGCYNRDRQRARLFRHGETRTAEHRAWANAKARCSNPNHPQYPSYGGRGIVMCERWRDSYETFRADMGPCPARMSLDRINNDGPYSPDNCRWATFITQANNRRCTRMLTAFSRTMPITRWAALMGITHNALKNRINNGWRPETALTTPVHPRACKVQPVGAGGGGTAQGGDEWAVDPSW